MDMTRIFKQLGNLFRITMKHLNAIDLIFDGIESLLSLHHFMFNKIVDYISCQNIKKLIESDGHKTHIYKKFENNI